LTLTASTTATTARQQYYHGTSGSLSHTTTREPYGERAAVRLSLSASPASLTVTQGNSGTSTITVNPTAALMEV